MTGEAWVAEVTVVDTECYAAGPESDVSLWTTEEGAWNAVRAKFQANGIPSSVVDGTNPGEYTERHEGANPYEWTWLVTRKPINE